jgi:manganese-dependent inorganic pyrophosphatase
LPYFNYLVTIILGLKYLLIQFKGGLKRLSILVFGHKNPDTDSVASAIALAYLKSKMNIAATACILDTPNPETQYMLDFFKIPTPKLLDNVNIQVKDIDLAPATTVSPETSILSAYNLMAKKNIKTLGIAGDNNPLSGIITMKDIAMSLIGGDFYQVNTSISNILQDLGGELLTGADHNIQGHIQVIAYNFDSAKSKIDNDSIIILGDRYDVLTYAIVAGVKLIILTGNRKPPEEIIQFAHSQNASIITVKTDTYTTAKLLNQCNYISTIVRKKGIVAFNRESYLNEVKEEVLLSSYRNYPVLDEKNLLIGFIHRRHVLNPGRKKVILVDHNEYGQSAPGLHEAEILEIVDHHKLGDISTSMPISFRNIPVGSTCTIIYTLFKEQNIAIPYPIAGALISGIISDTLFLKSPTASQIDRDAIEDLNKILQLDLEQYSTKLFRAGTSLEGQGIEEIFTKGLKEFFVNKHQVGISQVFTLDIENVFNRKNQFIDFISKIHMQRGYFLTLLLVTDILKEGSYLLFKCENKNVIPMTFGVDATQGVFVKGYISRKKQVLPKIMEVINLLQ